MNRTVLKNKNINIKEKYRCFDTFLENKCFCGGNKYVFARGHLKFNIGTFKIIIMNY